MVFYVYFDPPVIASAESGGDYALQCLIGVLRGFEANCLLAEFDDYFVQDALQERLNNLHDDNVRKALKSLFATLQKRNRFIYSLFSQGEPPGLRVASALIQGKQAELDLVLAENPGAYPNPHGIPICALLAYNTAPFEASRFAAATGGRTFAANALAERDFLDWTLRKALKHCTTIRVYDRLFGEKFRGNFEYSARAFIGWLEVFVADPGKVRLHIHCGRPLGNTEHFIRTQLALFRANRLAKMPITIQFYETISGAETLPHERYLITDQLAIDLGRGLDFLEPATQKNRDGKFSFASFDELANVLKALPTPASPPITF